MRWLLFVLLVTGCSKDPREAACRAGRGTACFELGAELQRACGTDCPDPDKAKRLADLFTRGCDANEPRACHDLGYLYARGVGVKQDIGQGITLYRRACDQGVPRGCSNYAWELRAGVNVPKNLALAKAAAQRACDDGDGPGCCQLGRLLQFDEGFVDWKEARRAYARGCDALRDGCSCGGLATMVERGQGGAENLARAARLYEQGCTHGDDDACGNLGYVLVMGRGVAPDVARGTRHLEQACGRGEQYFCVHLARAYELADAGAKAEALLETACSAGELIGCVNRGVGLERSGDGAGAVELYERACDKGELRGCTMAGHVLLFGRGLPKDEPRALQLYARACASEPPEDEACHNQAWMLHEGKGGEKDLARAVALARALCDRDHAAGCIFFGAWGAEARAGPEALAAARAAYERACGLGSGMGCSNLGVAYRDGEGVRRDHARAVKEFRRACELDDVGGCSNLGIQLFRGLGAERDVAQAVPLLTRGCEDPAEPDAEACFWLARAAREGAVGGAADPSGAAALSRRACELGFKQACR